MSRAFVKEPDGDAIEALPDRPVSEHPNIVTAQGLAQIDDAIARLQAEHTVAQAAEDRSGLARIARDLRYWTARRASAELSPPPPDTDEIRFGATVTIERDDGRRQTYRIVGEDEADPRTGTISHASPMASALLGKAVGDAVSVNGQELEITGIA